MRYTEERLWYNTAFFFFCHRKKTAFFYALWKNPLPPLQNKTLVLRFGFNWTCEARVLLLYMAAIAYSLAFKNNKQLNPSLCCFFHMVKKRTHKAFLTYFLYHGFFFALFS